MFETRLLGSTDYDEVADLIAERFATFIEYDKAKHKTFVTIEEHGFDVFKANAIDNLCRIARERHLNEARPAFRMYGSLKDGRLMSFLAMHVLSAHEWMFDNIKAREAPLSHTGLQQTFRFVYQTVKRAGLTTYYFEVAQYRHEKFRKFLTRLVPEYAEYAGEIVRTIPAHSVVNESIEEGRIGRYLPLVDLVVKRMTLMPQSSDIRDNH